MDIRNVELSIEDILSIHRHWVSKLYTEEGKSEVEIVELLYERHLPVTIDQIQRCLLECNVIPLPRLSRRGSDTSATSSMGSGGASGGEWDVLRSPSPASSISSYYSTSPENVDLYSKRPLPSLPTSSKHATKSKISRPSRLKHATTAISTDQPARFASHSPSTVTKVTSHQTKTRTYEVQTTLSTIEKGPSPLDMFKDDMCQSHERIAVGLRRVNVEYRLDSDDGKDEDFEWMRQFKEYKGMSSQRREVKILQDVTEDEHGYEGDEE